MGGSRQRQRLTVLRALAALSRPLRPAGPLALPAAPRILLIRPDHIGDLLFATPALRLLRQALPDAYLAALVGPWGKAVWEPNPHLDEQIVCEFPGFTRQPKASALAPYRAVWEWAQELRSQRFDLAIVLRFDHWWGALLAYTAGIPRRLGYAIPECQPFLTAALPYVEQRHEVQQNLTLVQEAIRESGRTAPEDALDLEFTIVAPDRDYAAAYLARLGPATDQPWVAIHPGAGAAVKLWQPEAWAQVADALVQRVEVRIVITGSRAELDLAWSVYAHMQADALVAAGDTTLGQLAALFQHCRLVLGPDCGPLHLAVATGTPTVHLYGPVDACKFGPWGEPDKHLVLTSGRACIPCNRLDYTPAELPEHPCVREIAVEAVLEAAEKLLATTAHPA
jgi:lipopolysaccharide heptosyltransferase II